MYHDLFLEYRRDMPDGWTGFSRSAFIRIFQAKNATLFFLERWLGSALSPAAPSVLLPQKPQAFEWAPQRLHQVFPDSPSIETRMQVVPGVVAILVRVWWLSAGINGGMLSTDAVEHLNVFPATKAA